MWSVAVASPWQRQRITGKAATADELSVVCGGVMPPQKCFFFAVDTHTHTDRLTHTHRAHTPHTHSVTCQFNFLIKHAFNFKSARRGQSTAHPIPLPLVPTPTLSPLYPYGTARLPKTAARQHDGDDNDDGDDTKSSYQKPFRLHFSFGTASPCPFTTPPSPLLVIRLWHGRGWSSLADALRLCLCLCPC